MSQEKSDRNEVYYCGYDDQQQMPSQGERCVCCNRPTVTWQTDKQTSQNAKRRWMTRNGIKDERELEQVKRREMGRDQRSRDDSRSERERKR